MGSEGTQGKQKYSSTLSLASELDEVGGQLHANATLSPGKRRSTYCTGRWVVPRASLDWGRKSRPHRDSIYGPSSS
jgi:hypothetical protein